MTESDVASATYTLEAATPTFSPPGGTYLLPQLVQGESRDRGRVLIVDDSRFVRAVVARHLKKAGFLVKQADPGATAMRILSGDSIDVVITDLRLPELDRGHRRRRERA